MSKIGSFFRRLTAAVRDDAADEKAVELRALREASADADELLDNALMRVLHETDELFRKLRRSDPPRATGTG